MIVVRRIYSKGEPEMPTKCKVFVMEVGQEAVPHQLGAKRWVFIPAAVKRRRAQRLA